MNAPNTELNENETQSTTLEDLKVLSGDVLNQVEDVANAVDMLREALGPELAPSTLPKLELSAKHEVQLEIFCKKSRVKESEALNLLIAYGLDNVKDGELVNAPIKFPKFNLSPERLA